MSPREEEQPNRYTRYQRPDQKRADHIRKAQHQAHHQRKQYIASPKRFLDPGEEKLCQHKGEQEETPGYRSPNQCACETYTREEKATDERKCGTSCNHREIDVLVLPVDDQYQHQRRYVKRMEDKHGTPTIHRI